MQLLVAGETTSDSFGVAGTNLNQKFALLYQHVQRSYRSLIVFDNADNLEIIKNVLPPRSLLCHVLVTTRVTQPNELFKRANSNVLVLGVLDESTALTALISLAGKEKESLSFVEYEAARKIAVDAPVEMLPLAISHAAAYVLRHSEVTFEAYLEKLIIEKKRLEAASLDLDKFLRYFHLSHLNETLCRISIRHPDDLRRLDIKAVDVSSFDRQSLADAVTKLSTTRHAFLTWEMDISDIEDGSPVGYSILCCCAVVHYRLIPQKFIANFVSVVHGKSSPLRVVEGLGALKMYTLLKGEEVDNEGVYFSMHPLVHQSVLERLRRNKALLTDVLTNAAAALQIFLGVHRDMDTAVVIGLLISYSSHIYAIATNMVLIGMTPATNAIIRAAISTAVTLMEKNTEKDLLLGITRNFETNDDLSDSAKEEILRLCMCFTVLVFFVTLYDFFRLFVSRLQCFFGR